MWTKQMLRLRTKVVIRSTGGYLKNVEKMQKELPTLGQTEIKRL